jgi:hypothetical protein
MHKRPKLDASNNPVQDAVSFTSLFSREISNLLSCHPNWVNEKASHQNLTLFINIFIKILDLPTVLVDLWMRMPVDSMDNRQPGLQGNTRVTEFFLRPSCTTLMLQIYSRSMFQCNFASSLSVFTQCLWVFAKTFYVYVLTKCWGQNFY